MSPNNETAPVGYDAFRTEYTPKVNSLALKKDLQSYLGEYRFQVQRYNYELAYGLTVDGKKHLRDINDKEPMVDKAQRAIDRRIGEGRDPSREIAEKKGLESLDHQLGHAQFGDQVIWISPPGLKSEGYGDYAFIFVGTVDQIDQLTHNKHLSLTALRVDQPHFANFNLILSFLTGQQIKFTRVEQFLAMPKIIPYFNQDVREIIVDMLNLQPSDNDKLFDELLPRLSSSIDEFVEYVKQGKTAEFLFKALQSIEMYALDLIDRFKSEPLSPLFHSDNIIPLQFMMSHYKDRTPPAVAGSCGSSNDSEGETTSSNIFNNYSSLSNLFKNTDYLNDPRLCHCGTPDKAHFHCPGKSEKGGDCKHPIIVGTGTTECPACHLKATCA